MAVKQTMPVRLETHGSVPAGLPELVAARITSLLRVADGHIEGVRIVLTRTANPAVSESATARVVVVVDGRVVLAQAADTTTQAAVEHMIVRLRMRLERMALAWEAGAEVDQSL